MTLFNGSDNWRAAMQEASQAITETMGECVRVTPAVIPAPNFPSVPQPEHAVVVAAVYTAPHRKIAMGRNFDGAPIMSTRAPQFQFAYGVLPFALQQYYRLERICNGELFEVTDVRSDSVSMITCDCVQLGRPKAEGVRTVDL